MSHAKNQDDSLSNDQAESLVKEIEAEGQKVGAASGVGGPLADALIPLVVAFLKEWLSKRKG